MVGDLKPDGFELEIVILDAGEEVRRNEATTEEAEGQSPRDRHAWDN